MESSSMNRQLLESDHKFGESVSPLESLPRELVWMIIEKAPETVLSLRQTSRLLNSHVTSYALEPLTSCLVNSIEVNFNNYKLARKCKDLPYIYISVRMTNYRLFTLRAKLHFPTLRFERKQMLDEDDSATYKIYLNEINSMLNCVGKQIGEIHFIFVEELAPVIEWAKMLEGIHAHSLEFSIDKNMSVDATNLLLKLVHGLKVDKITLAVSGTINPDPVQLLTHLSTIVRTIDIDQYMERDEYLNSHYLFGDLIVDWTEKIAEMFSGKLDYLAVVSRYQHRCLDDRTVASIKERLATLGKKVRFEAEWQDANGKRAKDGCFINLQ